MNISAAHRKITVLVLGLFVSVIMTSALVSYWASTARALTVPKTSPLFYSGLLADTAGKPLAAATATVGLALYPAQSGGSASCTMTPAATPLTQGRFRIALSTACVIALQDNPDLWIEVTVGKTPMARTKIGAVPYVLAPDMIKVDGDASLTIHSNTDTPTSASKMLVLKTGKTTPTNVFTVDNKGSVGIGTAMPVTALHIKETGPGYVAATTVESVNGTARVDLSRGDAKYGAYVSLQDAGIGKWVAGLLNGDTNSGYGISTDGLLKNAKVYVNSLGNVGIGMTNPLSKLAVKGLQTSPPDTSGTAGLVCVTNDGNLWLDTTPSTPCQ